MVLRSTNRLQSGLRPLSKPQIVGIWRLTAQMHEGRWCDIYAAQPADAAGSPRSDYAVKITRLPSYEAPEAARQIRVESASRVQHPNIIAVLDGHLEAARPYLVMPRLDAVPLSEMLHAAPAQPLPVTLWWARQCAQGLAALHAAGGVHGDLTPNNALVDTRGHVTLIDFGLASSIGNGSDKTGSKADATRFQRSANYTAPEVLHGGTHVHGASDVYSLGKILEQLTAATRPPLKPVTELAASMTHTDPRQRPTAAGVVTTLLQLEIDTLHMHIQPTEIFARRAA